MIDKFTNNNNPLLPLNYNICDCEAHVFSDGVLHVVGSVDIKENEYCSKRYHHIYTRDMVNWTIEQDIFSWTETDEIKLYAPDFCEKEGIIYLFFCLSDGREAYISANEWKNLKESEIHFLPISGIDPAVIVDGKEIYYFWGQFNLNGSKISIQEGNVYLNEVRRNILTEEEHFFHEGFSIRKINNLYYALYASIVNGKPTCLDYAIAKEPFGPYERKGTVIDNLKCDPKVWNNHGSIEKFNGQWYVFYHRSYNKSPFMRHLCIEKINFDEKGNIEYAHMTSSGIGQYISANKLIQAKQYAELIGKGYLKKNTLIRAFSGDVIIFRYIVALPNIKKIVIENKGFAVFDLFVDEKYLARIVCWNSRTKVIKWNDNLRTSQKFSLKIEIKKSYNFMLESLSFT